MALIFRDLRAHPDRCPAAVELYQTSFPPEERMPVWMLKWRSHHKTVRFYSVEENGRQAAIIHLVTDGKTAYLLYFAVEPHLRGQGCGSRVLTRLKEMLPGQAILLCVEPLDPAAPNLEQRQRRLAFYKKNGFAETGYQAKEGTVIFDVLSFGPPDLEGYVRLLRGFIGWPLRLIFHPCAFPRQTEGSKKE